MATNPVHRDYAKNLNFSVPLSDTRDALRLQSDRDQIRSVDEWIVRMELTLNQRSYLFSKDEIERRLDDNSFYRRSIKGILAGMMSEFEGVRKFYQMLEDRLEKQELKTLL